MEGQFSWTGLVVAALLAVPICGYAEGDEGRDLVKRMLDALPTKPFTAKAKLTSDRGWERELSLSRATAEGMDKIYMEVTAPMDLKDTRFLLFDRVSGKDEQFMFVPAMKRSIQLNMETRKQEFLGSDFAIADLVRPEIDAYTYSVVGDETVNGRACKLIQSVPKNPQDELYSKSITAIDPKDLVVVRTQFFDTTGRLLKTWTIDKLEKVDGNWTPLMQRMVSEQNSHWSKIELQEVKYDAQLPADIFNRSYLIR